MSNTTKATIKISEAQGNLLKLALARLFDERDTAPMTKKRIAVLEGAINAAFGRF